MFLKSKLSLETRFVLLGAASSEQVPQVMPSYYLIQPKINKSSYHDSNPEVFFHSFGFDISTTDCWNTLRKLLIIENHFWNLKRKCLFGKNLQQSHSETQRYTAPLCTRSCYIIPCCGVYPLRIREKDQMGANMINGFREDSSKITCK